MVAFPEVLDGQTVGQGRVPGRKEPGRKDPVPGSAGQYSPCPGSFEPKSTEALGDEIARLSAHIHAATYQLLVLIRMFDERGGWGWGFQSCAEWLSWRTGVSPGPAREKVRVARALGDLPLLSQAMARGELSFSKVRALTRVANADNESELLELARQATAAHLERIIRGWKLVDRLEDAGKAAEAEAQRHASRFLRLYPDHDGSWMIRGRLDPEVGALLEKALEWARESLYQRTAGSKEFPANEGENAEEESAAEEGAGELKASPEQRLADALGLVAERALAAGGSDGEDRVEGAGVQRAPISRAERFQVVVHVEGPEMTRARVSAETRADLVPAGASLERALHGNVSAETSCGHLPAAPGTTFFPKETSKRIACDADLVEMTHDSGGQVLDVGRKRRTVPPAMRRALDHRDGGCRFPGCNCRYADAHHVVHWADGGETKLENLVLLCRRHHRAVHEAGFRVEARQGPEGFQILFYRPDGTPFPEVPRAPTVPVDAMADLVRGNRVRGIDPDAWTATPLWNGETLDLGLAIDMLRGLEGGARGRGGGRGAGPLARDDA